MVLLKKYFLHIPSQELKGQNRVFLKEFQVAFSIFCVVMNTHPANSIDKASYHTLHCVDAWGSHLFCGNFPNYYMFCNIKFINVIAVNH